MRKVELWHKFCISHVLLLFSKHCYALHWKCKQGNYIILFVSELRTSIMQLVYSCIQIFSSCYSLLTTNHWNSLSQQNLWILWWVQETIQYQAMENIHWLFQLSTYWWAKKPCNVTMMIFVFLLHSAALVEDTILCIHGGLSPDLHSMDQVW